MHRLRYNVGTMNNTSLQLTIRGLDKQTKDALSKKATQQGMSLNRYALKALKQNAGMDDNEAQYLALKQFLNSHQMNKADKIAFDDAISWADTASIEKQIKE